MPPIPVSLQGVLEQRQSQVRREADKDCEKCRLEIQLSQECCQVRIVYN
jgi:hypothetical protein